MRGESGFLASEIAPGDGRERHPYRHHGIFLRMATERRPACLEGPIKCIHCRREMKSVTAPFHVDRHGYHLLLDTVPAWVRGQRGEPYLESREVEVIQEGIKVLDRLAFPACDGRGDRNDVIAVRSGSPGDPNAVRPEVGIAPGRWYAVCLRMETMPRDVRVAWGAQVRTDEAR